MSRSVQRTLGPMELERVQEPSRPVQDASRTSLKSVQEWLALIPRAQGRAGCTQKETASDLGISQQQFSTQLSGRDGEHVSFTRMRGLPVEFWRELIPLIADFYGITLGSTQRDAEDAAIGRLVREAVTRCR